jgi:amino acid transporter
MFRRLQNLRVETYGLRSAVLSPFETLAQSVSTMAPSTSPTMTIPLVFALAGNGTWLVYLLATLATLLVGFCVSRFAQLTASPGSLYTYTAESLSPGFGVLSAWALLLAYLATGISVVGGALYFSDVLLKAATGKALPALLIVTVVVASAAWIAYQDVKLSARLMLWIEIGSMSLIAIVVLLLLWRHGVHIDMDQLKLKGVRPVGVRLGLVLPLFSFVGFESATTLGAEAREPLRTIPRVVLQCALIAGLFFIACSYAEVMGFHGESQALSESTSSLHLLAAKAGVRFLGVLIDMGALVSMVACVLACITAAARVLLRMAHGGLMHRKLGRTHALHSTPGAAVIVCGALTLIPSLSLAQSGVSGFDIYGWMGSLATYGFLTAYALMAAALPFAMRRHGRLSKWIPVVSMATVVAVLLAIVASVYPLPPAPYRWLPIVYVAYLLMGMAWFALQSRRSAISTSES